MSRKWPSSSILIEFFFVLAKIIVFLPFVWQFSAKIFWLKWIRFFSNNLNTVIFILWKLYPYNFDWMCKQSISFRNLSYLLDWKKCDFYCLGNWLSSRGPEVAFFTSTIFLQKIWTSRRIIKRNIASRLFENSKFFTRYRDITLTSKAKNMRNFPNDDDKLDRCFLFLQETEKLYLSRYILHYIYYCYRYR